MQKTRFGVIGAGYGQTVLVSAIRRDPRAEVAAIAATSLEKARRVATRAGIPYAYGTWQELVDSEGIDAGEMSGWRYPEEIGFCGHLLFFGISRYSPTT